MKKITIQGKQYAMPDNWSEITLKQQMKVSADSDKIENASLKKIAILSGYANIDINILKHMPIAELQEVFKNISFINEPIPETPITYFEFNGSKYYAGQNLIEMEFQDFVSIENILQEHSGNTHQALPVILAIMCKRKKENGILETLDDYDVMARAKEFENIPLSIANGLSVFFYTSVNMSSMVMELFSNPDQLVEMKINEVEHILKKRGGMGFVIRCVYGILRYCLKYIKRKQVKHYTSMPVK